MGHDGNLPLDSTIASSSDQKSSQKAHLKSQGKVMKESTSPPKMIMRREIKSNYVRPKRRGYNVSDLQTRRKVAMAVACAKKASKNHPSSPQKSYPLMNLEEYLKERGTPCGGQIHEHKEEDSHFSQVSNLMMKNKRFFKDNGHLLLHANPRDGHLLHSKFSGHSYEEAYHHNHTYDDEEDDNDEDDEDDGDGDGINPCVSDRSGCVMSLPWPSHCSNNAKNERLLHYAGSCFYGPRINRQIRKTNVYNSDGETAPLMTEVSDSEDSVSESDGQMILRHNERPCNIFRGDHVSEAGSNIPFKKKREISICNKNRSISRKYRPKAFKDLIGQNMVAESLSNAILRSKIAPLYLFHGPRGTGKTSAAKIFACAMNCLSIEELRPCGLCNACMSFNAGTYYDVKEVDAAGNCGIESMRILLKHLCLPPTLSRYKVFIMEDCHMLTPEAWNALLKSLEDPPDHVVFILITSYLEQLPRVAISRCQKFMFARVKDGDIILRLHELAQLEKIEIDSDALHFIASQSDGSFRDAETMLDQLSLRGKRVTLGVVREMMGLIPDEELFNLLDSALASDTVSTVENIRELMGAGFEPLALVSQLATLITDILAGRCRTSVMKVRRDHHRQEKLQRALRVLSDVEKQLRSCSDRTTWLTAAFLQLANPDALSLPSSRGTSVTRSPGAFRDQSDKDAPNSGRRHSWGGKERDSRFPFQLEYAPGEPLSKNIDGCGPSMGKRVYPCDLSPHSGAAEAIYGGGGGNKATIMSPCTMDNIWRKVLQACQPHSLKQLLQGEGRLVSLSVTEAFAIARLEYKSPEHKAMAEKARESISNAFQLALFCPVKVEIQLCKSSFAQKVPNSAGDYQVGTKQGQESAERSSFRKSCSSIGKKSPLCHDLEQRKTPSGQEASEKTKMNSEKSSDRCGNDFLRIYKRPGDMNSNGFDKPINGEYDIESHTKAQEQTHCLDDPKSISLQWNDSRDDLDGYSSDLESGERYAPGGLLCWKGARSTSLKDDKAQHHHGVRRRRTRFLVRFVPCAKEEED